MRRFKGPNDVEEARQAVHKVNIARIKRVPLSFHVLLFTDYRLTGFREAHCPALNIHICTCKKAPLIMRPSDTSHG